MYNVWYDFALLPVIGVGVFLILSELRMSNCVQRMATSLATASFGIYLVHYPMEQLMQRFVGETSYPAINVIWMTLAGYVISWAIVTLAGKTRPGRWLFLIK